MSKQPREVELRDLCARIGVGLAIAVTPYMAATGVKLIRNQNIRPNKFDDSSVVFILPSFAASQASKTVRSGDVVIVRTGANIGNACVVPKTFDGSQSFTTLVVRADQKRLSPEYLAQFINSSFGRSEVDRLMAGGGKGNLNSGSLERFRIRLLPIDEQKKLSTLLATWDSAIEMTEKLIAAKQGKLLWISSQSCRKKPHWIESRLGTFLVAVKRAHGSGDYEIASVGKNGIRPRSDMYSKSLSASYDRNILVEPGWICFGLASDSIAFGVNQTERVYSVSPAYRTYEIREADPGFFALYLKANNKRLSKRFLITSARQGKAVDFNGLLNEPCHFPPLDEQRRISAAIAAIEDEVDTLRSLVSKYVVQKRGLMQKLLTGQWRLPVQEEAN